MKQPNALKIKDSEYCGDSLSVSHLDDVQKVHVITMSYGELASSSLNKTQVKKLINWLNRWVEFKEQDNGK